MFLCMGYLLMCTLPLHTLKKLCLGTTMGNTEESYQLKMSQNTGLCVWYSKIVHTTIITFYGGPPSTHVTT